MSEWKLTGETFIYELNSEGSNRWWLNVAPGWGDNGKKLISEDVKDVIELILSAPQLRAENAALKLHIEKIKNLSQSRWNDGLLQGQSDAKHIFEKAAKAKDEYLSENERLTNLLLAVEAERDALKAKLDGGIRVFCTIGKGTHRTNAKLILDDGVVR